MKPNGFSPAKHISTKTAKNDTKHPNVYFPQYENWTNEQIFLFQDPQHASCLNFKDPWLKEHDWASLLPTLEGKPLPKASSCIATISSWQTSCSSFFRVKGDCLYEWFRVKANGYTEKLHDRGTYLSAFVYSILFFYIFPFTIWQIGFNQSRIFGFNLWRSGRLCGTCLYTCSCRRLERVSKDSGFFSCCSRLVIYLFYFFYAFL